MKVVINGCYGGFSLSDEALDYLGIPGGSRYTYDNDRTNPKLVECVEKLGTERERAMGLVLIFTLSRCSMM